MGGSGWRVDMKATNSVEKGHGWCRTVGKDWAKRRNNTTGDSSDKGTFLGRSPGPSTKDLKKVQVRLGCLARKRKSVTQETHAREPRGSGGHLCHVAR